MGKLILIFAIILIGILGFVLFRKPKLESNLNQASFEKGQMKITSSAFANNQMIPSKYTCDGGNVNPSLEISDVPKSAKSLALIMDDPDAPAGIWVHWTLWNIDPKTSEIAEHSVPPGAAQGVTSFGKPGYGGPCPPSGTHRYFFKLYALDLRLDLSEAASKAELEGAMREHILEQSELTGLYSRK